MSEQRPFPEEMSNFSEEARNIERLLQSLEPRASRINRDRLMFLAGEASMGASRQTRFGRVRVWAWPTATVCSVCLGLGIGLWIPRPSNDENRPVAQASDNHGTFAESNDPPHIRVQEPGAPMQQSAVQQSTGNPAVPSDPTFGESPSLLALRNRMLANTRDDTAADGDSLRLSETAGVGPDSPSTYGELLRRMLDEKI